MEKTITLLTSDDCFYCQDLKERLIKLNIYFDEIEVNKNFDFWNRFINENGCDAVPVILIREKKGVKQKIFLPEKDYNSNDEAITIIKKNIL
jgi:glutaredoxin